jgi:hypothetical protein
MKKPISPINVSLPFKGRVGERSFARRMSGINSFLIDFKSTS